LETVAVINDLVRVFYRYMKEKKIKFPGEIIPVALQL